MRNFLLMALILATLPLFGQDRISDSIEINQILIDVKDNDEKIIFLLYKNELYDFEVNKRKKNYYYQLFEEAQGFHVGRLPDEKKKDIDKALKDYNSANLDYQLSLSSVEKFYNYLETNYPGKYESYKYKK